MCDQLDSMYLYFQITAQYNCIGDQSYMRESAFKNIYRMYVSYVPV